MSDGNLLWSLFEYHFKNRRQEKRGGRGEGGEGGEELIDGKRTNIICVRVCVKCERNKDVDGCCLHT